MKIEMFIELSENKQISLFSNNKPNGPRFRNSCIRFHKKDETPNFRYQKFITAKQATYLFNLIMKSINSGITKFEDNGK